MREQELRMEKQKLARKVPMAQRSYGCVEEVLTLKEKVKGFLTVKRLSRSSPIPSETPFTLECKRLNAERVRINAEIEQFVVGARVRHETDRSRFRKEQTQIAEKRAAYRKKGIKNHAETEQDFTRTQDGLSAIITEETDMVKHLGWSHDQRMSRGL
jgi:hypothetical protein